MCLILKQVHRIYLVFLSNICMLTKLNFCPNEHPNTWQIFCLEFLRQMPFPGLVHFDPNVGGSHFDTLTVILLAANQFLILLHSSHW